MTYFFAQAFGILMVLTAARPAGLSGVALLAVSAAALLAGLFLRRAAVVAVLLVVGGMAVAAPSPFFAAVSGLSAAVYLVLRYTDTSEADNGEAVAFTMPTVLGLLGFTAAGVAATAVSLRITWIPLLAPAVVVAILILVAAPLWGDENTGAMSAPPDAEAAGDVSAGD